MQKVGWQSLTGLREADLTEAEKEKVLQKLSLIMGHQTFVTIGKAAKRKKANSPKMRKYLDACVKEFIGQRKMSGKRYKLTQEGKLKAYLLYQR